MNVFRSSVLALFALFLGACTEGIPEFNQLSSISFSSPKFLPANSNILNIEISSPSEGFSIQGECDSQFSELAWSINDQDNYQNIFIQAASSSTVNCKETGSFSIQVDDSSFLELVNSGDIAKLWLISREGSKRQSEPSLIEVKYVGTSTPTIEFALSSMSYGEESISTNIEVKLSESSTQTVEVTYSLNNLETATLGTDFTMTSMGVLSFAPGETSKNIAVNFTSDTLVEGSETFTLVLSLPNNALLGTNTSHTATILDDDAPVINFLSASASFSEGAGSGSIQVSISPPAIASVDYAIIAGGSATEGAGEDYVLASGTLNFTDGTPSQNISFTISNDNIYEGNETFSVRISNPSGANLGGVTTFAGTITDNDSPPDVRFLSTSGSHPESIGSLNANVILSHPSAFAISIDCDSTDGSAVSSGVNKDFDPFSQSFTFLPGETSKFATLTIHDDTVYEGNQNFTLTLSSVVGAASLPVSTKTYTGTITDNDVMPDVKFSLSTDSYSEGTIASPEVILTGQSEASVTVSFLTSGNTATGAGVDYNDASGTLSFAPYETSKNIGVNILSDLIFEDSEDFTITLSAPSGAGSGSIMSHTATINDTTGAPTVQFQNTADIINESDSSTHQYTVELSHLSALPITVDIIWSGSATSPSDFSSGVVSSVVVPSLTLSEDIDITIGSDITVEGNETIVVTLDSADNGVTIGANNTLTVTVEDDDTASSVVSFTTGRTSVSETEGFALITYTIDPPLAGPASFEIALGGSANGSDYGSFTTNVVLTSGVSSGQIPIAIMASDGIESDEQLNLTLQSFSSLTAGTIVSHTLDIRDSDYCLLNNGGTPYAGGDGSEGDPYIICSPAQLNAIGLNTSHWSSHFKLKSDIDMSVFTGTTYNIIGNTGTPFEGEFNGNGFAIKNLTYSDSVQSYVGLFGVLGVSSSVHDLEVIDANMSGATGTGVVAGKSSGSIQRVFTSGSVSSNASIHGGGIVGSVLGTASIQDSYSNVEVTGPSMLGGVAGATSSSANLYHVFALGNIIASSGPKVGGLVGYRQGGSLIDSMYLGSSVTANDSSNEVGLIYGGNISTGLTNVYYNTNATCTNNGAGWCNTIGTGADPTSGFFKDTASVLLSSWDFYSTWRTDPKRDYPLLYFQQPILEVHPWGNHAGTTTDGNVSINTDITNSITDIAGGRPMNFAARIIDYTSDTLTLSRSYSPTQLQENDEILWIVVGAGSTSDCNDDIGKWGNLRVTSSITSTRIGVSSNANGHIFNEFGGKVSIFNANKSQLNHVASASSFCTIQIVRVPNYQNLTIDATGGPVTLSTQGFDYNLGYGGIFALRVNDHLDFNTGSSNPITIDLSGKGFAGGSASAQNGEGYSGIATTGNSNAVDNGGASYTVVGSTGGGGGNFGAGGDAANYSEGGLTSPACTDSPCLYFGGGGGASYSTGSVGGKGGGIIFIWARNITRTGSGLIRFKANGASATGSSYGSGGGAGGTILLNSDSLVPSLNLDAKGGNGNGSWGGGGGGGGGVFSFRCSGTAPLSTISGGTGGPSATVGGAGASTILDSLLCGIP